MKRRSFIGSLFGLAAAPFIPATTPEVVAPFIPATTLKVRSSAAAYLSRTPTAPHSYVAYAFSSVDGFKHSTTFYGNGKAEQSIEHSLGRKPNMIITKRVDGTGDWVIRNMDDSPV